MLDDKNISAEDARTLDRLKQRYGLWALRAYFSTGERIAARRRSCLLGDDRALPEEVLRSLDNRVYQ